MKPKASLRHFLALAGSSLLATSSAALAQSTWDGDTSANWSDVGNWDIAPTNGVALTFSGVLNQANSNGGALANIGLLTLNGDNWNINLGTLTLNGGITSSGTSALAGTLTLGAAQTWQNSTGLLTVTGSVANLGNLLTVGGAGNTTINSAINGLGGLTKQDAGILTLGAASSYTGLTTVSGGELRWGINSAVSSGSALIVNNTGTANLQNFTGTVNGTTLNQGGAIIGGTGSQLTAGSIIANNGGSINMGTGQIVLSGASLTYNDTIVGSTTLSVNRLYFGGNRTFTIADGDDASGVDFDITEYMGFGSALSGRDVIKEGSGVMRLSGSVGNSNLGASQTLINDGTLLLNKSGAVSAIGATGLVQVGDGTGSAGSAILRYTGASTNQINSNAISINSDGLFDIADKTDTVGAVTIAKGGQITGTTGVLTTSSSGLISNNGGSISGFSTGYVAANLVTYDDTIVGSTTLNIQRLQISNTVTFDVDRGDDVSGVDVNVDIIRNSANAGRNLVKNGTGVLQLSGSIQSENNNLGTGTTTINDGTVIFNKSVTVAGWGSGLVTIGDDIGSAATAVLQLKTSSNQITSGTITIKSDGRLDLNGLDEATTTVTNDGSITTGAGTLTLGASTFSGASTATGNLNFTGTTATALTIGGTASINATTTFSAASDTTGITATGTTSIAGTLALGTARSRAIAVTGATDQLTISAQLTGGTGRTLTKSGLGSLTLSADNTGYAATISVTGGTLLVNNTTGTGTGSGAVNVGALGTLGGTGTISGAVTVDGALKPGNSTGLLTVGSLDLNASASTTLEINGLTRGAVTDGYDALGLNLGGSIDLAGALSFEFGNLAAFAANTEFDLFSFDTTSTGDFGGVTSTGFYAGTWGKTGDIWSLDSGGQTLSFSEATGNLTLAAAIPEPNVAALIGGFGLLALLRRRR